MWLWQNHTGAIRIQMPRHREVHQYETNRYTSGYIMCRLLLDHGSTADHIRHGRGMRDPADSGAV